MPRLRNSRTGVVVNDDDATAARLTGGRDKWVSADEKPKRASKSDKK